MQSLLHGSEQAKAEGETEIHQHSRLIGRNKVRVSELLGVKLVLMICGRKS